MNDQAVMYRWISIGLAILVVVVLALWLSAKSTDPVAITEDFQAEARDYKEEIKAKCTFTATSTSAMRRECETTLEEFSDILREYKNELEDRTGTTTMPTTTPSAGGAD